MCLEIQSPLVTVYFKKGGTISPLSYALGIKKKLKGKAWRDGSHSALPFVVHFRKCLWLKKNGVSKVCQKKYAQNTPF